MTQYPAQLLRYVSIVSGLMPYGAPSHGLYFLKKFCILPSVARASATVTDSINCKKPCFELVAKTLYGVSLRSKFSRRNNLSMSVIICRINWSWRKSSPCLKIASYSTPSVVRKVSFEGIRADLNKLAFLATMPLMVTLGSSGKGMGSKLVKLNLKASGSARSCWRRSAFLLRFPLSRATVLTSLTSLSMKTCWRARKERVRWWSVLPGAGDSFVIES